MEVTGRIYLEIYFTSLPLLVQAPVYGFLLHVIPTEQNYGLRFQDERDAVVWFYFSSVSEIHSEGQRGSIWPIFIKSYFLN